jgi:tRNA A-37 threonylcarbamoyl transferase component Bud32
MPLAPGVRLGGYEIVAPLGAGAMGEVYRAHDTKLNRAVAIKVLAPRFASDPERLARFRREAKLLAALNHPNIAAVHTFEDAPEAQALVLELVEGQTLQDRIAKGSIPLAEALAIAKQLADAFEAAHARGIIHRDLKPANIKVRSDGTVKVLDFGLARLTTPDATDAEGHRASEHAATRTSEATEQGVVLGTPAYMSPEQARGEAIDRSVDIWAYGVVIYEMLTGHLLFARRSAAETISAVLMEEPDWDRIPEGVRRLVRSCLAKDPAKRLRDIGDARLLLEDQPTAAPVQKSTWLAWTAAAIASLLAAGAVWAPWRTTTPAPEPVRFHITTDVALPASGASAISPDGRHLAFLGIAPDGTQRVWVRDLNALVDRALPGSRLDQALAPPFWSPDSRFIAFDGGGELKKIDASGGLAQSVCPLASPVVGGSWNSEGTIIIGTVSDGILRVNEAGGTPSPVTIVDGSQESAHMLPVFLSDGRRFFYLRISRSAPERTGMFVGSLDVPSDQQDRRRLLATLTSVAYATTGRGRGTLFSSETAT